MFTTDFDDYVCEGDTISLKQDGFLITARIERDDCMGPPWEEHDGHGPVSEWRPRDSKRAGEKILHCDRGSCRFYNWQKAIEIAKKDQWDAPPYGTGTKGEQAERAVQRDFDSLRAWCNDEWWWGILVLSVSKNGVELDDHAASLGGIDVNHPFGRNKHLREMANDLISEAIKSGKEAATKILFALNDVQA